MPSRSWSLLAAAAAAALLMLGGCANRMPRDPFEAAQGGYAAPDGAAFLGYHGRVERAQQAGYGD